MAVHKHREVSERVARRVKELTAAYLEKRDLTETSNRPYSEAFMEIAHACGRVHGSPLPKRVVEIGTTDAGWHVALNPTSKAIGDIKPFEAHVSWGGCPAGILDPYSGVLVGGDAANEDELISWCKTIGQNQQQKENGNNGS